MGVLLKMVDSTISTEWSKLDNNHLPSPHQPKNDTSVDGGLSAIGITINLG